MISVAYAAAEHAAEHGSESLFMDPHFWVYVSFFVVVGILFKPVFTAAAKGLDARAVTIKERIDEAQKLQEDASAALALYQRKQQEALKDAQEIVARAKADAEALAAQAAKDLEATLARREKQALDRIAQAEAQAQREVTAVAVDVAIEAARAVLAKSLSGDQATHLVDDAIKELAVKLH
jgi:F-type H+-transporting ATPase subunit b